MPLAMLLVDKAEMRRMLAVFTHPSYLALFFKLGKIAVNGAFAYARPFRFLNNFKPRKTLVGMLFKKIEKYLSLSGVILFHNILNLRLNRTFILTL